jgi:hypothetical protein
MFLIRNIKRPGPEARAGSDAFNAFGTPGKAEASVFSTVIGR